MTRNWHIGIQLFALFGQMVLPDIPGLPEWTHKLFHSLVSFGQAALAIYAHGIDPGGQRLTPAPQDPPKS